MFSWKPSFSLLKVRAFFILIFPSNHTPIDYLFAKTVANTFPRSGKTVFPVRGTPPSLLEERILPCSRTSSNTAREVRAALLEGLDSGVSRVSIRAYQGSRYGRVSLSHSGVGRRSLRARGDVPFERREMLPSGEVDMSR